MPASAERQADTIPNMYPCIGAEKKELHEASPHPFTYFIKEDQNCSEHQLFIHPFKTYYLN